MRKKEERFTVGVPLLLDMMHYIDSTGFTSRYLRDEMQLPEALLNDPDGRAPFGSFEYLWNYVVQLKGNEAPGLLFGKRKLTELDLIAALFASKSSAFSFLGRWAMHENVVNPAVVVQRRVIDDEVEMRIHLPEFWIMKHPQASENWAIVLLTELLIQMKKFYPAVLPRLLRARSSDKALLSHLASFAEKAVFSDPSGYSIRFSLPDSKAVYFEEDFLGVLLDERGEKEFRNLEKRPGWEEIRSASALFNKVSEPKDPVLRAAFAILAQSALRSTFLATLELAVIFDFSSHQQFARTFKEIAGIPPRQWRKAYFKNPAYYD